MHELGYYYSNKKERLLTEISTQVSQAGKLLLCAAKGDAGITPRLSQMHLYRWGGYASKNGGNQFILPVFIADPIPLYCSGGAPFFHPKTPKPVIGFCGQGRGGAIKWAADISRNLLHRAQNAAGLRAYDNEALQSSTCTRAKLLDRLEKSELVNTRFIRFSKYRGGASTKEQRETGNRLFYHNMLDTQYTFCYRGAGNFSVRLFETLSCGRIPIIVRSDNNLPLPEIIDWNRFPMIWPEAHSRIADEVARFHQGLSNKDFVALQQYARYVWENYLTYPTYMQTIVQRYASEFGVNLAP